MNQYSYVQQSEIKMANLGCSCLDIPQLSNYRSHLLLQVKFQGPRMGINIERSLLFVSFRLYFRAPLKLSEEFFCFVELCVLCPTAAFSSTLKQNVCSDSPSWKKDPSIRISLDFIEPFDKLQASQCVAACYLSLALLLFFFVMYEDSRHYLVVYLIWPLSTTRQHSVRLGYRYGCCGRSETREHASKLNRDQRHCWNRSTVTDSLIITNRIAIDALCLMSTREANYNNNTDENSKRKISSLRLCACLQSPQGPTHFTDGPDRADPEGIERPPEWLFLTVL